MERFTRYVDASGVSDRAVEHLLANCAVLSAAREPDERRPVFDRLRDLLGADLTRLLLFGLAGQRARSRPPL
jgi:hypothetical protein